MKQQNIIKKAMAFLLVFCLVAVEYGSCAYAETISETNEFAEKQKRQLVKNMKLPALFH